MKTESILDLIGNTPHLRLKNLFPNHEVWIKLERQNPGGSLKDRIALAMIEDAELKGLISQGSTIIEPTSGNTGIGLALAAALKGYELIITMPESMSIERRKIMEAYGAKLVLTPRELGMSGAIEKAHELHASIDNAWIPQQFENNANPTVHYQTTAQEIIRDFPEGFDYFISGVGTGGHISGVGKALKEVNPNTQVFAVEPDLSTVIAGGNPSPHALQGIGAGFIPDTLEVDLLDGTIAISKEEAFEYAKRAAKEEGLFGGISTGASLAAVAKKIEELPNNAKILTFNYDTGERYLSVADLY